MKNKLNMDSRVKFSSDNVRKKFFNELVENNFKLWKNLQKFLGISSRSVLEKYRSGEYTLPLNYFLKLLECLPNDKKIYFNSNIIFLDSNWGQIKGGKVTQNLHPWIIENARKYIKSLGGGVKYDFDLDLTLNTEICEFLGAFIGDGFTNQYGGHYVIQFSGHSDLDKNYYDSTIIPIIKRNFGCEPYIQLINNSLRINFFSKRLYELLTLRLKIPKGKKSYTVLIPEEVIKSNKNNLRFILRGIFDTDGCIFFDKRGTYEQPYPRINVNLVNPRLIQQIYFLLEKFDLKPTISKNKIVQINGFKNVKNFLRTIGFSNMKHINRIKEINPRLLRSLEEYSN